MCIERTMQHEDAHALDAFLIVASELERVIGASTGGTSSRAARRRREPFGTVLTPEALRRACARIRGRGGRDFDLRSVRCPTGRASAMGMSARGLRW